MSKTARKEEHSRIVVSVRVVCVVHRVPVLEIATERSKFSKRRIGISSWSIWGGDFRFSLLFRCSCYIIESLLDYAQPSNSWYFLQTIQNAIRLIFTEWFKEFQGYGNSASVPLFKTSTIRVIFTHIFLKQYLAFKLISNIPHINKEQSLESEL